MGPAGIGLYLLDKPMGRILGAIMGVFRISMVGAVAQKMRIDVSNVSTMALSDIQNSPVKSVKKGIGLLDVHLGHTQVANSIRWIVDSPQDDGAVGVALTKGLQDLREVQTEIID